MPLIDHVKDRIAESLLRELTNQGDPGATTVNDTKLGFAVDDVEAEFVVETGQQYDDTDPLHIAAASQGVLVKLMEYSAITGRNTEQLTARYNRMLIRIAQTRGSEKRLLAQTDSPLEPSKQREGTRPDADRERWSDFTPNNPTGGDRDSFYGRLE